MADILLFVPTRTRTSQENLDEFIRACREDITKFGADLDWEANYWKSAGVTFRNLDQKGRTLDPTKVMKQPFLEFAKAYLRCQQGNNPTKLKHEMPALKCLERAFADCSEGFDVQRVTSVVFDRAAVLARNHYKPGTAYHTGGELARIATFLSEKYLIPRHIDWKSPIARPSDTVRTGIKAREAREKKLPSAEAKNALARIFASRPTEARDMFTTSAVALFFCAPSRVTAILALPENCEVWETKRDGTKTYSLSFQPGKGAAPMLKRIPDPMISVAQDAIQRIRKMTTEGRRIAYWLENKPSLFYRHAECPNVSETEPLSIRQVAIALGIPHDDLTYVRTQLGRWALPSIDGDNTLASLNRWVHGHLPSGFPWFDKKRGVRFSEALFCMRDKQLRTDLPTSPFMIWKPTHNIVNNDLCSRKAKDGYLQPSIFDRHNYNVAGQPPLKLTTHQPRHELNTKAQRGGMSQSDIAFWSNRIDVKQNRAYDQMDEFELSDMLRRHDPSLSLDRPLVEIAEQIAAKIPMTRQEFNILTTPAIHVTEVGYCGHDMVMSTCQRYRDCLNCTEQIYIKGDKRLARIRVRYTQVKALKQRADEEIAQGTAGADRWYEIQALTEKRLASLIAILDDPTIEDGAIVRLSNENEFSPLRRVLESKGIARRHNQKQLPALRKPRKRTRTSGG